MVTSPNLKNALAFTEKILERGITGKGPFKGSQQIADEALKYAHGDAEKLSNVSFKTTPPWLPQQDS